MCFVQQKLLYKQRVYTTLEHTQKKVSQQCSAMLANDVLNEEAQVRERFYQKEVAGSIFKKDIQQVYEKMVYW